MSFLKNKKISPQIITTLFLFAFLSTPIICLADATACDSSKELCNPIRFGSIPEFFEAVLKIAAEIGAVIIILAIIYSGFLFVTARGNQEELSKAKKAITYTVIGAILVLGAWAFSVAISNTIKTITNPTTSITNDIS